MKMFLLSRNWIDKRLKISRSIFTVFLVVSIIFYQNYAVAQQTNGRPNIVLIMTDQHQAEALSIAGNLNLHTPNLDKLAKTGIRFENAYVTFPLCVPSRSSIFTGKYPHTLGVNSNKEGENKMLVADKQKSLGNLLREAGYDCAYGGKWHAPEAEISEGNGFDKIAGFGDMPLAQKSIDYLKSKKGSTKPFFLVASFDNPHNICEWARNEPLAYGNVKPAPLIKTPQLPINFKKGLTFPEALQLEQDIDPKSYPTRNYTSEDWRQYRYTYYKLIEQVDAQIGKIIDAIDDLGLRDNTVIIFTSDHGDGNASHGWNQKTALFQESIKVPFIISHKSTTNSNKQVQGTLISNGIDLFPTICDYAGIAMPKDLLGRSVKPIVEGKTKEDSRKFVVVETKFEGNGAYGTMGRALITKKYKYVVYSWAKNREQFFDLEKDPHEMKNLINAAANLKHIDDCRQMLLDWCKATDDKKFMRKLVLPTTSTMSSTALFDKPY